MIKQMKRTLLALAVAFSFGLSALAQTLPPVPVDTVVRIGHLPNGLTYYIRHNEKPKGQADFYIAQKVGSILEEDNQRGLAHFLEHMCFNGTENFPGNTLVDWLATKGVKFGRNLNAYTAVDETVYNISNVPTANTAVQDSCLLILHDWADGLLLDPEEIDKERGVIHEEWRLNNVGQMRILENLLPTMYPDSKYGYRLPIGTIEVIDNFTPQALRDYYETWYRPDNQAIIVVGDIDVDYIEGKIKEMFSPIQMPENPKERYYEPVPDTPGTIYALGSDPEQQQTLVEILFKTDAFPDSMKNNQMYLINMYAENMLRSMLATRFNDLSRDPEAPFAGVDASYGNYFLSKTKDALTLGIMPKGNNVLESVEAAYREMLRAKKGFTVGEYQRAREEYLSRLEKAYNGRDNRESSSFVSEYVQHFTDNEPIPSIEDEYAIMQQYANMIPVDLINQMLPQIITDDNRVVLGLFPQNDQITMPTEEEFAAVFAKVDAEDIEPYKDTMKEEPLIPQLPTPGKVVSVADDAQWGAKVLTLSNGVKVYVKNTDFKKDEIKFAAIALGGTSTIGDDQAINLMYLPLGMAQSGLGDYTNGDLEKYLQGKQASVNLSLSNYARELEGNTTVKDLPTMMELLYMTFIDFEITENDFNSLRNLVIASIENQEVSPNYQFSKFLNKSLYTSAASQALTADVVKAADREAIIAMVHNAVENAADYTFFFVGDVDVETLTPLLEQYVATLPANSATATKEYVVNEAREPIAGSKTDSMTYKMETPQTTCVIALTGTMPYTLENDLAASAFGQILTTRLVKKIREDMGAVYSISAAARLRQTGKYNVMVQSYFPMKPELKDEVLGEIRRIIEGMQTDITEDELDPIKQYMLKNVLEDQELNSAWMDAMEGQVITGVDTFNDREDAIDELTVEDVENFIKELLKQDNYHVIILDPEP